MINIELLNNKLEIWLEYQRLCSELSDNTLKTYRNSINKFLVFLSYNNIYEIKKQNMLDYKKYLDQVSNSVKSKNLWIITLNKYLKFLKLDYLCLKQIKNQKKFIIKNKMSISDYKRLLRIAKRINFTQDYWIMRTLTETGIRFSELKYFTVESLKRENNNIIHIKSKGKERDIIIPKKLAMELRKYIRDQKIKSGYIFTAMKNQDKPLDSSVLWKHLKKIASIARVNKSVVHAHSFRHLFATTFNILNPGNNILLADLMGHNSLNTTRIYTELSLDEKQVILSKMKF